MEVHLYNYSSDASIHAEMAWTVRAPCIWVSGLSPVCNTYILMTTDYYIAVYLFMWYLLNTPKGKAVRALGSTFMGVMHSYVM